MRHKLQGINWGYWVNIVYQYLHSNHSTTYPAYINNLSNFLPENTTMCIPSRPYSRPNTCMVIRCFPSLMKNVLFFFKTLVVDITDSSFEITDLNVLFYKNIRCCLHFLKSFKAFENNAFFQIISFILITPFWIVQFQKRNSMEYQLSVLDTTGNILYSTIWKFTSITL